MDRIKNTVKNVVGNTANSLLNLSQPDGNYNIYMVLNGKEYELRYFETEFRQEVDYKGQPQQETKGGLLALSLYDLPGTDINNWMMIPSAKRSGAIEFRQEGASTPLRLYFTDAYCINYYKEIGNPDIGVFVRLVLSPTELAINNDLVHANFPFKTTAYAR